MRISTFLIGSIFAASLAGCAAHKEPEIAMKNASGVEIDQAIMQDQAVALTHMTQDILRKSTAKGASIGALAGCGLAVLAPSNAQNCVTGAAVGLVAGAVAGNAAGRSTIAKRIKIVSPSALVKSIGKTHEHIDQIQMSLPKVLAAQDIELAELTTQIENGEITEDIYTVRAKAIMAERAALAEALTLSAAHAQTAHANLLAAQSQGQTGLDWHLSATKELARDVMSARSTIDLL